MRFTDFSLRSHRSAWLLVLALTAFAITFGGCGGDDKKTAAEVADAAIGSTGTAGTTGASGSTTGEGESGANASDSAGSGSSSTNSGGARSDSKSGSNRKSDRGGKAIKDNNEFDNVESDPTPNKLTASEKVGLGKALGQASGAADEFVRDPLSRGRFKADSQKQAEAIETAELAAPYITRKLMVASASVTADENYLLHRDLAAAAVALTALNSIRRQAAARTVVIALGVLDSALRTARKAGVKIRVETPSRSELR